ncbi:MAG: hypothetical protein AAGF06_08440, partial [Pseudomonadota bacterium]
GVNATKTSFADEDENEDDDFEWGVYVSVAEFIREEPFESRFRSMIHEAISGVEGVESAYEQDRELWGLEGDPSGEALVHAVLSVLRVLESDIKALFARLDGE